MDTMTATAVDHPLGRLLHHAARRSFPPADGRIEVLDPPPGPCDAAIVFTGHAVVAAAISDQWTPGPPAAGRCRRRRRSPRARRRPRPGRDHRARRHRRRHRARPSGRHW